jgi:HNH endonuclease
VRQITDDQYSGETGIHSVQNGLLLTSGAHLAFDKFLIAINPDVRITEVLSP